MTRSFRHLQLGPATITWLSDGQMEMPNSIFPAFDPALLDHVPGDAVRLPVAAFLIRHDGVTTLVDTSSPSASADGTGHFHQSLADAGVSTDEIDQIVVTHLHSDHYGGLSTPGGAARFGRARLLIAAGEWRHKHDPGIFDRLTADDQASFGRARNAVAPYAGRTGLVTAGQIIAPGISVLPLPGHTPGHIGLTLRCGGQEALILGDLLHYPPYQMANPGWSVIYDTDPDQAVATRTAMLEDLAGGERLVLGAHLGRDGFCRIARAGRGYALTDAGGGV
ncbi:MAG: MBL fold metallo-hydrolase [Albidovulum sp.]|uniref:MBL fold metallo-hydrolase n=1 Tax=Albidovulum sp. TaxID=1872424 RepID=UPI003CBDE71F